MRSALFQKLESDYDSASGALFELLDQGKFSEDELIRLLGVEDHLIISTFLESYSHFSETDLDVIQEFIVLNLDNEDRFFVSDLIEFATDLNLELPYEKCIAFLPVYEGDHTYVQLAVIDYLFENLKLVYIASLCESLKDILQNSNCNQSVQVKAAFVLYRVTGHQEFLADLIDLVVNGSDNKELLKNILDLEYNDEKYFSTAPVLRALIHPTVATGMIRSLS